VAKRRQRRRREKEQRHAPTPVTPRVATDGHVNGPNERLVYSREQAAQALGVSLATLDRRIVPAIATVKTEWGARLIPVRELERYLAERTEHPRLSRRTAAEVGRKPSLPREIVARIRHEHARGASLAEIARGLNRDDVPTGQAGRQWWRSTVRAVLLRSSQGGSARTEGAQR
jgi:hypothetical protein